MRIHGIRLLSAAAALCFLLAGCTGAESAEKTRQVPYAVILQDVSDPFWAAVKKGVLEEANQQNVKVDLYAETAGDPSSQTRLLENCLSRGYQAIAVAPSSTGSLDAGIHSGVSQDVLMFYIGESRDSEAVAELSTHVCAFVWTDEQETGKLAANFLLDKLNQGGQVCILGDDTQNSMAAARQEGAVSLLETQDHIELAEIRDAQDDRQIALEETAALLDKYPDLKAIYCTSDLMALGALQAVKNADRVGQIMIIGSGGTQEAVQSVEEGELTATAAPDPAEAGAVLMRQMIAFHEGGAQAQNGLELSISPCLITKDDPEPASSGKSNTSNFFQ